MRGKLRAHLNYANVMATIAVFGMLGGVSYAAVNLPNNSVGSGEIKKNAVKSPEIAKNAVKSPDVKNRSLKCVDLAPAACAAATGATPGDGPGNVVVRGHTETLAQTCHIGPFGDRDCFSPETLVTARCATGERAVGGGWEGIREGFPGGTPDPGETTRSSTELGVDRPDPQSGTPTGWTVEAIGSSRRYQSTSSDPPAPTFTVYAVCAS